MNAPEYEHRLHTDETGCLKWQTRVAKTAKGSPPRRSPFNEGWYTLVSLSPNGVLTHNTLGYPGMDFFHPAGLQRGPGGRVLMTRN